MAAPAHRWTRLNLVGERDLATVELLGALAYAQLRGFAVTAAAVRHAPDLASAERVAAFAVREHDGYLRLRKRLQELTDLPDPPMERQRARTDAFFDHLPIDDWLSACTFFAVGLPMAADFARAVAPALDETTAEVVVEVLADREAFQAYASEQVAGLLAADQGLRERTRRLCAEITGSALTEFQGAVSDTDALLVLLQEFQEVAGPETVRQTAVSLLEQHRRRLQQLGIDTPE